jgi:hypothetical protein
MASTGIIQVTNETYANSSRITKEGRKITYRLKVIQQPERARACGSGAKCKYLPIITYLSLILIIEQLPPTAVPSIRHRLSSSASTKVRTLRTRSLSRTTPISSSSRPLTMLGILPKDAFLRHHNRRSPF